MYVTRTASSFRTNPETQNKESSPEGHGSGSCLVVQDDESEAKATCFFGMCKDSYLKRLPFPQNRLLTVEYTMTNGQTVTIMRDSVYFIPVADKPLPSNQYYVVIGEGEHRGEMCTCSTKDDKRASCFCSCVDDDDLKPMGFNPNNVYQHVEIIPHRSKGYFSAKSVCSDGIPSNFLRRKYWKVYASDKPNCRIEEAYGIEDPRLVETNDFSSSSVDVVGKWICPFIFVKEEELQPKDQLTTTMFYEMTLERFWEVVYRCQKNKDCDGETVNVNVNISVKVENQRIKLNGNVEVEEDKPVVDGVKWFKPLKSSGGGLGLCTAVVDRMESEQHRRGWISGESVVEVSEKCGHGDWSWFTCFVLVERFALKRMDGSLALTCDFKHTRKNVRHTWE